jgi:hypothetical protein
MSRRSVNSKVDTSPKNVGWTELLADVKTEIEKTKKRLSDLEGSARIAERKIQSGEPFPYAEATQSTQN